MDPSLLPQNSDATEDATAKAQKAAQEEQMRREILATVLDQDARERLNRIALVNPQLSSRVELIIVRMVQTHQLKGRVSEAQLITLLDQADSVQNPTAAKKGAILFQRRKDLDDDDWDI